MDIYKKLDLILEKIDRIELKLNIVEDSCNGMDTHINFINTIYNNVKIPFEFIIEKASLLQGKEKTYQKLYIEEDNKQTTI
jgi:hypothetical protein